MLGDERGFTPEASKREGREAALELDAFLAAHPDALTVSDGRVRCLATGDAAAPTQHCLPCHARLQVTLRLEPSTASNATLACTTPSTSAAPSPDPR